MRLFGITVVVCSTLLVAGAGAAALLGPGPVDQPIAFNHSKHVQDLGLDCTVCHLYARTGTRATIPNIQVCGMCHTSPLTESPEEAHLVEHIESQEPIPWRKVYWVPEHVYFSHRRHTSAGEIQCETCHGAIGELSTPVSRQLVEISMDGCVQCHRLQQVSTDCINCHR